MTWPEQRLWAALRNRRLGDVKFRRQQVVGPFIVDFLCPQAKLVIEVDGQRMSVAEHKTSSAMSF